MTNADDCDGEVDDGDNIDLPWLIILTMVILVMMMVANMVVIVMI